MKKKKTMTIFLPLSLGITSSTLLVDRFLINVPDWIAISLSVLAIILLIYHIITVKKKL